MKTEDRIVYLLRGILVLLALNLAATLYSGTGEEWTPTTFVELGAAAAVVVGALRAVVFKIEKDEP